MFTFPFPQQPRQSDDRVSQAVKSDSQVKQSSQAVKSTNQLKQSSQSGSRQPSIDQSGSMLIFLFFLVAHVKHVYNFFD